MNSHEMFKTYIADIGLTKVQYEAVCDLHKACFESNFTVNEATVYGDDGSEGSYAEATVSDSNTSTSSTGNPVIYRIQSYLNKTYNSGLIEDGLYGPKTSTALYVEMNREKNPQRMESLKKMWNDVRTLMEKKQNNKNINKNISIASNQQN